MSDDTRSALEAAISNHLQDEGMLRDGELVTDWLVLTANVPRERTEDEDGVYTVTTADHMMSHQSLGLAAWYLHDRHADERRD